MNERLFLKLLLALFFGLFVAELLVVLLFGFRLELIVFCFVIAVAVTGMLVVARLLLQQRAEIDSVSSRRAKAKRSDVMHDRLREYSIDEEFLGGERFIRDKGRSPVPPTAESRSSRNPSAGDSTATIEEAIKSHAEMYGGLGQLLLMMEKIDDNSFGRLVKIAGLGELSREEVILKMTLMVHEESSSMGDGPESDGGESSMLEGHTMDKESFDEYIRRCMSGAEHDEQCGDGITVDLDDVALLRGAGRAPEDFEHNPKSVIASLKRAGMKP
ncbi:MAG: hypothetical protein FDX02_06815 [Chlorobium sp.]|nr:MAG: hypothetical protein FDX02_06815 [Chlorobium sp.]